MRLDGPSLAVTVAAVVAATLTFGVCGGGGSGGADAPNRAAYLTIVHSPLVGTLAARDDATLLDLGQRACGDLDSGMRSDAVVADLGGDPLPGSGEFNGYSMITAAAARASCARRTAPNSKRPPTPLQTADPRPAAPPSAGATTPPVSSATTPPPTHPHQSASTASKRVRRVVTSAVRIPTRGIAVRSRSCITESGPSSCCSSPSWSCSSFAELVARTMSPQPRARLEVDARSVLDRNRRGVYTCPSSRLYPHQWLWDSCFIAIGVARYDAPRAAAELRALFRGQWANGMLPHIVFGHESADVGSRRIWQSRRNPLAPRDVDTSCITQPPLPAIAARRVAQRLPTVDRRAFLDELYPKLVAYHSWLYDERDLQGSGLVTLIHPWEGGLDTTPPWMQELCAMPMPLWLRVSERLDLARVVRRLRNDTRYLPAAERASDDEGLRMLVLATRAKAHDFELRRMPREDSVLIQDVAFNAILAKANQSLTLIAGELGQTVTPGLSERMARTDAALESLWDEGAGQYFSRNAKTGGLITLPTIATFLPLWSGVPTRDRATRLLALLKTPSSFWPRYPVPSVPLDAPEFREAGYWKGPTWVNTAWMIVEALQEYGEGELAEELRVRTIDLVARSGFSEYFSPVTGAPYGAPDFSWTAALIIDLLSRS